MTFHFVLTIAATAQAAMSAPPRPTTTNANTVLKAVSMCERVTHGGELQFPADAKLYMGAFKVGSIEPTSALPDLLKRYSAAGLAAVDSPSVYVRFIGDDGEAWSVIHAKSFTCDVVTTGFRQSASEQQILAAMNAAGWSMVRSSPATQTGYLSQYLLAKMMPTAAEPSYGVRAIVRSLGFTSATASGVQMEMNFAAGKLTIRPPTQQ